MIDLPIIEGRNVYLRGLDTKDADGNYPHWLNDPEVTKYNSHGDIFYTKEMALEYIQKVKNSTSYQVFAIIDKSTQLHIGNISLQAIDFKLHSAEFAILIGEPSVYRKGVGHEAGRLLLDYGFNVLSLHHIYCGTAENNIGMQKLAIKLGMRKKGKHHKALLKNGIYHDIIRYDIQQ